jgi:hypothetical protein
MRSGNEVIRGGLVARGGGEERIRRRSRTLQHDGWRVRVGSFFLEACIYASNIHGLFLYFKKKNTWIVSWASPEYFGHETSLRYLLEHGALKIRFLKWLKKIKRLTNPRKTVMTGIFPDLFELGLAVWLSSSFPVPDPPNTLAL